MPLFAYVHGADRADCLHDARLILQHCVNHGLPQPAGYLDFDWLERPWHRRGQAETLAKRLRRGDTLLVTNPFRVFGPTNASLEVFTFLRNRGVELVIVEPPEAILGLDALLAADQAQQALADQHRTEQTRQAIRNRKNRGRKWNANAPLGYRWFHRTLRPWPAEQAELARVVELHDGGLSWQATARRLLCGKRGTVRNGRDWTIAGVRRRYHAAKKLGAGARVSATG